MTHKYEYLKESGITLNIFHFHTYMYDVVRTINIHETFMFNNYAKKRHESNNNSFPITEIISLVEDQDNSEYSQWWFLWQVVLDWNNQFLSFLQSCPSHPTSCQNNMIQGWIENFEPIFHQSFNVENIKFALCILTKKAQNFHDFVFSSNFYLYRVIY